MHFAKKHRSRQPDSAGVPLDSKFYCVHVAIYKNMNFTRNSGIMLKSIQRVTSYDK